MDDSTKITKAVIALAGYGTRFLPATKEQPKEMLPIIDKPIVQYLVEELVESGIQDIIMVTRLGQRALEDHFDNNIALEYHLEKNGKDKILKEVQELPKKANYVYVRQKRFLPYGNGTPLLVVKNLIKKNENFVYMFGDDLVKSDIPATKQLIEEANKNPGKIIIAAQDVKPDEVEKYGVIKFGPDNKTVETIIEKPKKEEAPSNTITFGRFILNNDVLEEIAKKQLGKDNELWLSDAIANLAKQGKVVAVKIQGRWMTTGDPLNFLKTTIEYAKDREDLWRELKTYIENSIKES
jgi:UTP--glucose-1-phosphate uridylyltransferase